MTYLVIERSRIAITNHIWTMPACHHKFTFGYRDSQYSNVIWWWQAGSLSRRAIKSVRDLSPVKDRRKRVLSSLPLFSHCYSSYGPQPRQDYLEDAAAHIDTALQRGKRCSLLQSLQSLERHLEESKTSQHLSEKAYIILSLKSLGIHQRHLSVCSIPSRGADLFSSVHHWLAEALCPGEIRNSVTRCTKGKLKN